MEYNVIRLTKNKKYTNKKNEQKNKQNHQNYTWPKERLSVNVSVLWEFSMVQKWE